MNRAFVVVVSLILLCLLIVIPANAQGGSPPNEPGCPPNFFLGTTLPVGEGYDRNADGFVCVSYLPSGGGAIIDNNHALNPSTPLGCQSRRGTLTVFIEADLSQNGLQDQGEPGVAGIPVDLLDMNGQLITMGITATSNNGRTAYVQFSNLDPMQSYTVRIPTDDILISNYGYYGEHFNEYAVAPGNFAFGCTASAYFPLYPFNPQP